MRRKSKVSCSCLVLPWWMMLALLLLLLDGSSAAPIPQSVSELMADDGKTLAVGPGKAEDNAVLVVDYSNQLSFTMFRPSCLGDGNGLKEINAEIWLDNSCKMYITWDGAVLVKKISTFLEAMHLLKFLVLRVPLKSI
uniref:Uncharacterized protein n=1 Tax=Ditylenchus dipsaci TaxID=166011 RepID=A0A915EMP2_9BILA